MIGLSLTSEESNSLKTRLLGFHEKLIMGLTVVILLSFIFTVSPLQIKVSAINSTSIRSDKTLTLSTAKHILSDTQYQSYHQQELHLCQLHLQ